MWCSFFNSNFVFTSSLFGTYGVKTMTISIENLFKIQRKMLDEGDRNKFFEKRIMPAIVKQNKQRRDEMFPERWND